MCRAWRNMFLLSQWSIESFISLVLITLYHSWFFSLSLCTLCHFSGPDLLVITVDSSVPSWQALTNSQLQCHRISLWPNSDRYLTNWAYSNYIFSALLSSKCPQEWPTKHSTFSNPQWQTHLHSSHQNNVVKLITATKPLLCYQDLF